MSSYSYIYVCMRLKLLTIVLFGVLFCWQMEGQDYALNMRAGGQNVHFEIPSGATDNFKTLSFWIKPNSTWDATLNQPIPIVVKDKYDVSTTWGGRFLIYVDNGQVIWTIGDYNGPAAGYSIASDKSRWEADIWYHMAFVLHPQSGMQMYVNGILQNSTNPRTDLPPGPVEGADEPFIVGAWGTGEHYYLPAQLDEFRIWSVAKTENDIRANMCTRVGCVNGLVLNYNFNSMVPNGLTDVCGIHSLPYEASITSQRYKLSTAPLGDKSEYLYTNSFPGNELAGELVADSIILTNMNIAPNEGMHIYMSTGRPAVQAGLPDSIQYAEGILGVWSTDTNARFDVRIVLDPTTSDCQNCTFLMSRDRQVDSFYFRTEPLTSCGYEMQNESDNGRRWREEYYPIHQFRFLPGMDDSLAICANGQYRLSVRFLQDATYLWDNGSTADGRFINQSGKYWVEMDYRGCKSSDTIYVTLDSVPEFDFGFTDTTICQGDTITIECPLPGVKYEWKRGDTTRAIQIWEKGIYRLETTYGICSHRDQFAVQVIPRLNADLGPDSTLCLGQERSWRFNPTVGSYLWWDGSRSSSNSVFNQPGTYWVQIENECFIATDTVTFDFIDCDCRIDIPNTFTPNLDRVNDQTGVFTRCYFRYYEFVVMDRWGNRVFYSEDANERWDGTFNGENCPQGIYSYVLSYRRWTGPKEPVVKSGTMMLLR